MAAVFRRLPLPSRRFAGTVALLAVLGSGRAGESCAEVVPADEAAVKAAFVYNFTKYVEWPADLWRMQGTLHLCIVGPSHNAFARAIATLGAKAPVQGKAIEILQPARREQAAACHVLVLTEPGRLADELVKGWAGLPVLTIGDGADFIEQGGVIGLVVDNERMRFEVNLEAAQRARLRLSSHLLKLARNVKGAPFPVGATP